MWPTFVARLAHTAVVPLLSQVVVVVGGGGIGGMDGIGNTTQELGAMKAVAATKIIQCLL
jgi:hypothetical protein